MITYHNCFCIGRNLGWYLYVIRIEKVQVNHEYGFNGNPSLSHDLSMMDGEDRDSDSLFGTGRVVMCWWCPDIVGVVSRLIVGD